MATAFEWFQFKDTGNTLGGGNPLEHHNHIFNVSNTLYHFSDKDTFAGLYKSTDDGENWTLHWFGAIGTATQIGWMTPDFTNGRLYIGYVRTTAGPFYNYQFSYVTLSNGVGTGIMDALCDVSYIVRDHFLIGATSIQVMTYENGGDAFLDIYEAGVLSISTNMGAVGALTYDVGPFVVVGTKAYCIWRWSDENAEIWEFDSGGNTFAEVEDCGAGTSLPTSNQRGVAYDGSNKLYFILVNGGLDYLYTYAISTDTLTQQQEYNIALMLDRNCVSTSNSPWEFEKAFHISNDYVYQITRDSNYLLKLQDLEISGQTIKAVTDKYLISSGHNVYKYTNSLSDFVRATGTLRCWDVPLGKFSHSTELSPDQLIEIYENNEGNYELCFRGKLGRPEYEDAIRTYEYKPHNLGWDDLDQKISYTATAEGADEVALALIGQLTNPYIYADATSIPNIAINITYTFDDVKLRDALYVLCILTNGYFWVEPDGYLYFSTYAAKPLSKWYFGQPDDFNKETIGALTAAADMDFIDTLILPNACICEILEEFDGHKNVLCLSHDGGASDPSIIHLFPNGDEISGTREYWISSSNITRSQLFSLLHDGTEKVRVLLLISKIFHYPNNVITDTGVVPVSNIFNHIKITFDCAAGVNGEYQLYLDEVQIGGDHEMMSAAAHLDSFLMRCDSNNPYTTYLEAFGDPADARYSVGDNRYDTYRYEAGNMTVPSLNILQVQHNDFSNVRGGWDNANNKEFAPTSPLIEEHILQYGKLLWRGRKSFVGANSLADLDAIITALKIWQGMVTNPLEISFYNKERYYYPVGYGCALAFSQIPALNFTSLESFIIIENIIDFLRPGANYITISNNITRRSSK